MKRILVAEDDPGIRDAIKLILESEDYEVQLFANGKDILNDEVELPDLFILDKQLSGIDGLDICKSLKAQSRSRDIPIIMISANPHILRFAKAAGADAALEKPFRMQSLKALVASCIDK